MRILLFAIAALCCPFLGAQSAMAMNAVEEKKIKKGKFAFDDEKGYIFLHGPARQTGIFLKEPNAEEIAAYEAEWVEKFAKAQAKYERRLERYKKSGKAKGDKKPEEVTRENFRIAPIELRNIVSFGPQYVFSKNKADGVYSYMMEVVPGTYIYYGPLSFAGGGAGLVNYCYCMGSVKFEVKAGQTTNLGDFILVAPQPSSRDPATSKIEGWLALDNASKRGVTGVNYDLPGSLDGFPSERADFRAAGKMDNFFGVTVTRMPRVRGILDYRRDLVVDVKAEKAEKAAAKAAAAANETASKEKERLESIANPEQVSNADVQPSKGTDDIVG